MDSTARGRRDIEELSRLVLHPDIDELRSRSYGALIIPLLAEDEDGFGLSVNEIQDLIEENYDIDGVPLVALHTALEDLESQDLVVEFGGEWSLSDKGKKAAKSAENEQEDLFREMISSFQEEVERRLGTTLSSYQETFVEEVFEGTLYQLLEELSKTATGYIDPTSVQENPKKVEQIIKEQAKSQAYNVEKESEIANLLPDAVKACFSADDPTFEKGLFRAAERHLIWRILGLDPGLHRYQKELFSETPVLLDTSFVISAICESGDRHEETNWLLDALVRLDVPLKITDRTISEYHDHIDYVDDIYKDSRGDNLDERLLTREISASFFENREKYRDWSAYIAKRRQEIRDFVDTRDVEQISVADFSLDPEKKGRAQATIKNYHKRNQKTKHPELVKHDAVCILIVQELREASDNGTFNAPWFVTHHRNLREPDKEIADDLGYDEIATISTDALFELIYPFLWMEVDESQAAAAFREMVGNTLLDLPSSSAQSFVGYVASELDLSTDDEEILLNVVEESHLGRVLEEDIEDEGLTVGLDTFQEGLQEKLGTAKELQRKDATIDRLVNRIDELETGLPGEIRFEGKLSDLQTELEEAKKAETPNEKGDSLESFGVKLTKAIEGWEVLDTRVRLRAEEIDIYVKNRSVEAWGTPILIECKNWSKPVGGDELSTMVEDLRTRDATTGLLISAEGITGREGFDGVQKLREFVRDGFHVVVLTFQDLNEIEDGDELADLIEDRWNLPELVL